jgi:hypothetical protein
MAAAVAAQTAATPAEWQAVADLWSDAQLDMMAVPPDHPQRDAAQAKVQEYGANEEAALAQKSKAETAWVPEGMEVSSLDGAIAGQWVAPEDCGRGQRCWTMEIVSRDGCANLYAEVALTTADGVNVGYTNDATTGIQPGQRTRLDFVSYEAAATGATLTELKCY